MASNDSWLKPVQAADRLGKFVAHYTEDETEHQSHIDLKLEHSLRVWEAVRQIANEEVDDAQVRALAEIGALYHDLGRFPQYKRYRTFKDSQSVDHGLLGFRTLRESGLLSGLSLNEARIVLQCVFLHNRAALPAGLPDALHKVLMLVRDGDKVDIVRVISGHLLDQAGDDAVLTLGLADDPQCYSPTIMTQAIHEGLVRYQDMVWVNDFKILICSWAFGLNFSASRYMVRREGHLERLLDSLPRTGEIRELTKLVRAALER
jgi:hypothetical protein